MKKNLSFFAIFAMAAAIALLFSACVNDDSCAHTWVWEITTSATYTADGLSTGHCSLCGATSTQAIPKLTCTTHNYVWRTATPATDDADGVAAERCSRCNHESGETEPIPAGTELEEVEEEVLEEDASEGDDGNVYFETDDDELESILSSTGTNPHAIVGPLLQTRWGQGTPYNDLFPRRQDGRRYPTDCGTTAVMQIMAFHKHPIRGAGQSTKLGPHGVTMPLVDLSSVAYDWDNILDHYRSDGRNSTEEQRNAVAVLFLHYGMSRGVTGNHPMRLVVNFGYDRGVQQVYRNFYTEAQWVDMIRRQLDAGLPVWYHGTANGSSHAFVIDGYDSQGRFHMNMGWRGRSDGWYFLDNINPGGTRMFFNSHKMIINIKPNEGSIGSNEMGLRRFTVNGETTAIQAVQDDLLTINVHARSFGIFPGGQRAAALVDAGGNIVDVLNSRSENFTPLTLAYTRNWTMRSVVPDTAPTGDYRLMIVTRMTGEQEWKIATGSDRTAGIPNAIPITIIPETGAPGGGYGLALRQFSTDKTVVGRNESFTVTVNHRNTGAERFPGGTLGVVLVDNDGYIVGGVLGTRSRGSLNAAWINPITINCTIPYYGIDPGNYRLRAAVKVGDGDWRICTLAEVNIPTSINFTVTEGVRSPFLDFFHRVAAYRTATGNIEVIVNQNLTIDQLVSIPAPALAGATITISSANPSQPVTLTRGVSGNLFTIANGATVIFRDIIIDGGNSGAFADNSGGTLVRVNGGTFIMNAGTVLRNNTNTTTATATLGGCVNANTNSTFTMNGGTISGNIAGGNGGGLVVTNSAVSTMSGGEISGNRGAQGGGVRISAGGVFTLVNGKINNNTATTGVGGGISVSGAGSTLNLNGGEINGNTAATNGGGVTIESSAIFNMSGGEISGNNGRDGGGIRMAGGTFTMQNGKIISNTASLGGGGVSISGSSTVLSIIGGSISGNTSVTNAGGGIAAWGGAVINMSGGEIIGNTAPSGNELRLSNSGGSSTFNQSGGLVSGIGANISAIISIAGSTHNLNTSEDSPNNAVIIAWNRPAGNPPFSYTSGTSADLTLSAGATATWANQSDILSISYANGSNTGWIKQW